MANPSGIALVLADVDGTLVTEQKVLTERARRAVRGLRSAGIRFAITSGRPPRGMVMLIEPLAIDTPVGGFNGGLLVTPELSVIREVTLPSGVAREAVGLMREHDLDPWVYRGNEWLITRGDAPHVKREASTVRFEPRVISDLGPAMDRAIKIVGVSDDLDAVRRCEAASREALGSRASASRSQPYYLDITHRDANKGEVVAYLSGALDIPLEAIATIGDAPNDVVMFRGSGFSIAMGNAGEEVRASASASTDSYNDEGFAKAIERYVLDGAGGA